MGVVRAWQCPACGRIDQHEAESAAWCQGEVVLPLLRHKETQMVPVFVVPASETRHGWLRPNVDVPMFYEQMGRPISQGYYERVGVFALPEENTDA